MLLSIAELQQHFDAHTPERYPKPPNIRAQASVALILCNQGGQSHVCMIKRTSRDDDRWSGHMALPGGRASLEDPSPVEVAVRETHEEVGLILKPDTQLIGSLDELQLLHHGDQNQGVLSPHVFAMTSNTLPTLVPDPREVAQSYWIPLETLFDPGSAITHTFEDRRSQEVMSFPALQAHGEIIWGLTYRVLFNFASVIQRTLPL